MTAKQLSKHIELSPNACSYVLWELSLYGLLTCLNPGAPRSRLYWVTELGARCQRRLRRDCRLPELLHDFPIVDWNLYGWVCFSHRSAIIKALTEPLQPATIKRRAVQQDSQINMSANNVRDVIRLFLAKGIVVPVRLRGKAHPRYELTEMGKNFQRLLRRSETLQCTSNHFG